MKILAICFQYDDPMPLIASDILGQLATKHTIDILGNGEPVKPIAGLRHQYIEPFSERQKGWSRRFIRWFSATPISNNWSRKAFKLVANDYDVVISFVNNSYLMSIVAGKYISQKLGCKFAIYTVDAIPAPGGWTRRKGDLRGKKSVVARTFSAADYVAASNQHMLEYQLSLFSHKPGLRTDVLLTPSPDKCYTYPQSEENIFLYTGTLYGLRNPNHFIKAFKRIMERYPSAQFVIVGMRKKLGKIDQILTTEERRQVITGNHTSDLEPYFRRAKVLVDIDADREKDPFLSSKMVTYLKVNRVILSETGKITPSREIFAGLNTVVQCDHNEDSLYEGMLRAIEIADSNPDFSERDELIKAFSIESVSAKFHQGLLDICPAEKEH